MEKFGSEIEISKPIPSWLWEGQITFKKHPTLKLNFTIPPSEAGAGAAPSSSQEGAGTGAGRGNHNSTSSSPSMSGSQHGGTAVVFPGQSDNNQHSGGGGGQLVNSSSGNSISSLGSTGSTSASAGGVRGVSNTVASAVSASGSGLKNHASRSSAKGVSRDRPGASKSNIRTDLQGQSPFGPRSTSIATPVTASQAQVRGKRAIVGAQGSIAGGGAAGAVGGGDHGPTENPGLGVRMNTTTVDAEGSSGAGAGGINANGQQPKSALISIAHEQGDRDQNSGTVIGKEFDSTTKEIISTQERTAGAKNSPASTPATVVVPEVVDEYYEVSMTLKALALEGADF